MGPYGERAEPSGDGPVFMKCQKVAVLAQTRRTAAHGGAWDSIR